MSGHEYIRPGQVDPSGVPDSCMTCGLPETAHRTYERLSVEKDWRAMREWLIKTRNDAQNFAIANQDYSHVMAGFQAQCEVLTAALDFMDERERAYLPGRKDGAS